MNTIKVIAQEGPATVVQTNGKYEVSMYGFHVRTFDNEVDAIERMNREAREEKQYAYK